MVVEANHRRNSHPNLDTYLTLPPSPPSKPPSAAFHSTTAVVAAWYSSNIGVLLLNKYLLSIYGYHYPIFLTTLHMLFSAAYSAVSVHYLRLTPPQHIHSRHQLLKIVSLSLIFCFSVVCGNASLNFIPISFNQSIGATTPFFTAVFSVVLTCDRHSSAVYLSLIPVVLGIVVATSYEPLFHPLGFLLCVCSTAGRALKSVVQGIILSQEMNSMNLLMYMAPMSAVVLWPISMYFEGNVVAATVEKAKEGWFVVVLLAGNATVAYLVNLTNFLVTKQTSALTLQVLGNAKAAVAAVVSVLIFRNPVSVMGAVGFGVTIMGVVLYGEAKKRCSKPTQLR
ncbi:hypothetical protein RND81_06G236600 [Saponaria officinalis]|uniref:Sugar phosphate transporter domain-containing protein n=1 Tax=Saponaria officinalis TaxID=3572 RepID=A0AAW1KEN3_SAPOF